MRNEKSFLAKQGVKVVVYKVSLKDFDHHWITYKHQNTSNQKLTYTFISWKSKVGNCVLYIIHKRFVFLACHSHNYPNLEHLRICNVLCQNWRRQPWLNTHFIPITPLHVSSNATRKDSWGEWQGLGKLTHRT